VNPPCNLPEAEQETVLGLFRGTLTAEEESSIREMFPQYLFFRNEYTDDGWNVSSDPVRLCTCTACGETFEVVRGNYARGKLHNEECNCPSCGVRVTGKAVGKFGYAMSSLESWIKTAVAYPSEGGALMIESGNVRRSFSHDDLTGTIDWYPEKRYYFARGMTQMWEHRVLNWACWPETPELRWLPTGRIREPFAPNMMGSTWYDGAYNIVGLGAALEETELKYCQILPFYERAYGADLPELATGKYMIKYLGWYCEHPQIEMAVKLGLEGAVRELIETGRRNARLLDWNAATPEKFLRMDKQSARLFIRAGMDFADLKNKQELAPKMSLTHFIDLSDRAGGIDNLRRISLCARQASVTLERAVRYIESQEPECSRYAPPRSTIIQYWMDYLEMASGLRYDLGEETVAMPRDLKTRHDTAAALIRHAKDEAELKVYGKRRKRLERKYAFALGGLCVLIPASAQEIVDEGQKLHHCVGGYAQRHVSGSATILFLRHERRRGRPWLTIEVYEDKGKIRIRQVHGWRNENYPHAVKPEEKYGWFLDAWLGWVNSGSPRDKAGRPVTNDRQEVKTA